jgi:calcineurin-like phosphoesterase family protein
MITSDLHLGHKNICKYRTGFKDAQQHHEILFENLARSITKRDTVYFLGDICFDAFWLEQISTIKCQHKKLIVGNHCTEHNPMSELVKVFDSVDSLLSKRNFWFTHCPIHPQEIRNRQGVIHGHLHGNIVLDAQLQPDKRFFNACVEHTEYKPISFEEIMKRMGKNESI